MTWLQLSVISREDVAQRVSDLFSDNGALSVTMQDAGNQEIYEPAPGETRIWQSTRLTALYEEGAVTPELIQKNISEALGESASHISSWLCETLEDQAWERTWLEHFKPMRFGQSLWVIPTGHEIPDAEATNLHLDPGLAFGTGTHATTALCLEWLDSQPMQRCTVLDFGCGSGILAIAAALLGAEQVDAIDIDPQAILATESNAEINHVSAKIHCCLPEQLQVTHAYDVVIANILAGPLIELAELICAKVKTGGKIVLSGILEAQAESVRDAYQSHIKFAPMQQQDGWIRLDGIKR